jgi:16S rRNA (cytosine967-C5)-methyltransferase
MKSNEETVPLWRQLTATAGVVLSVRQGVSGTAAIEKVSSELRAGVQSLAFHVWRNLGRAQSLRSKLANKPPPPPADALLCVALALAWQLSDAPYDIFTLVNQTVEAAKRSASTKAQANFLNACLRRFLRERDHLVAATDKDPVALWNHPLWWISRLKKDHPEKWQGILEAANRHAPMTLRINVRKTNLTAYILLLAKQGIVARATAEGALILECPVPVQRLPGFADGWVSVQDAAAQLAAPLLLGGLPKSSDMRILDACAAPGGKTGHLLELTESPVIGLEVDPRRVERIHQNLARLGVRAQVLTADAARPQEWWDGQMFDAILLDAPCTASGIVRRHPDVRWLRRESDIAQLSQIQQNMLQALWRLLRPGGRMVYCTCSLFLAEGSSQVQTFLSHNTEALLLPSPGHLIPQNGVFFEAVPDNQPSDYDGFYYALLHKQMV